MPYSKQFEDALLYAARIHRDQVRKKTRVPYITHVMSVAALVAEYGGDEDQVIAALLHDAVEDCGGAPVLEEIRRRFGQIVARIVDGCTDSDRIPKPPWRVRKEAYLAHVGDLDAETLLVSAADKLHNARAIVADLRRDGDTVFTRFKGKKEGTLWYYRALVNALVDRLANPIVDELDRTVMQMERLAAGPGH